VISANEVNIVGGAGSIGLQVAKALGAAKVISTVSTPKMQRAEKEFEGVVDKCMHEDIRESASCKPN